MMGGEGMGPKAPEPAPKAPEPKAPAPAPAMAPKAGPSLSPAAGNSALAASLAPASTPGEAFSTPGKAADNGGAALNTIGTVLNHGPTGVGAGVLQAPGNVNTLVNGVKPDGSAASTLDRAQSGGSLASLAANGTKLAADGVSSYATSQVAGNIAQSGVKGPVAQAAAKAAISGGSTTAIKQAARAAGAGGSVNAVKHATRAAMATTSSANAGLTAAKVASTAGKVVSGAGDAAALAGKGLARNGGRFVPGLNAGIAAMDSVSAYNDISDAMSGKASTGKAVTSGVRALGSIAAATNIPIVSQVGAGVSVLADLAQRFWWSK